MEKNESKYIRIMMINHPVHLSMLYKGPLLDRRQYLSYDDFSILHKKSK